MVFDKSDLEILVKILEKFPKKWEGKSSILEMKNNNFKHWRQMEWIGFYFEYLFEFFFKGILSFHTIKYGNVSFDGFLKVPIDFKAHAINSESHNVIINDTEATIKAIEEYGFVIVIMALGEVKYNDINRSFQKWHSDLKGGISKYEVDRMERGAISRYRKSEFILKEILIIKINKSTLTKCGSFQKDFRNSNGSPRNSKILLKLDKLDEEILERIVF